MSNQIEHRLTELERRMNGIYKSHDALKALAEPLPDDIAAVAKSAHQKAVAAEQRLDRLEAPQSIQQPNPTGEVSEPTPKGESDEEESESADSLSS